MDIEVEEIARISEAIDSVLMGWQVDGGPQYEEDNLYLKWVTFINLGFGSKGEVGTAISDLKRFKGRIDKLRDIIKEIMETKEYDGCRIIEDTEEDSYLVTGPFFDSIIPTSSFIVRPEDSFYHAILETMSNDIKEEIRKLNDIKNSYWGGRTKSDYALPHLIALDVARVYKKLTGKMPGFGNRVNEPSSRYTKAVKKIYGLMGMNVGFANPCKKAIHILESEASGTNE